MSETAASRSRVAAETDSPARRLVFAVTPLAMFVVGALGYEQLSAAGHSNPVAPAHVAPKAPQKARVAAAIAVPEKAVSAPARSPVVAQPNPFAVLRDERSLLELSRIETGTNVGVPRVLDLKPGMAGTVLAAAIAQHSTKGAYAIVRGMPLHARLSHGIAVGDESWLIDGDDVGRAAVEMREGAPEGTVQLELTLLSGESLVLAQEKVVLQVRAVPPAVVQTPPEVLVVPANPIVLPREAPVIEAAAPAVSAAEVPLAVTFGKDIEVRAGRGSLLRLDVTGSAPADAHVVLRGLPDDAVLSKGTSLGADVWLVGLRQLADLEVRVSARTAGSFELDARLVGGNGQLLAQDKLRLVVAAGTQAEPAKSAVVATPVAAAVQLPSRAAIPVQQPAPLTRAVPQQPAAVAVTAPATALSVPENVGLSRGRRMLELGNIAIARPLLERAAGEGSGEAAALLAASYDSAWLAKAGVVGVAGDPVVSRRWYEVARRLGASDTERIVELGGRTRR